MKRFIYITIVLLLIMTLITCITPEKRKELSDAREINNLTEGVGNKPWIGSPNNMDARGQLTVLTW